ncbi:MAG: hypothetical protein A3J74_01670 [Elusimicrobia bacterium RIFCSPHIGHO2_02_FULL_57_9]|nr:MAG: hypothetical protein A3J74_01670 [Elusimicrobia bacterium RIFCSPHIGHO2_02_FULL_57_9]
MPGPARSVKIPVAWQKILKPLAAQAETLNLPAYVVGGCVRDWILGFKTSDLDLVTEGDPAPLARFCAGRIKAEAQAFGRFGTLRVLGKNLRVDCAMSRRESYPTPACLPQAVSAAPLQEDLFRRDFTINAMALRLSSGSSAELIDPYGGWDDLRARVLRALHPAGFRDDPTRVFRAARFSCRFGLRLASDLTQNTKEALDKGYAALLSRHRLMQELLCVLDEKDPACAIHRLRRWGYLQLINPSLNWPKKCSLQGPEQRLGAMALALGTVEGGKFIRSLPLPHEFALQIIETLEIARLRASPRMELPTLTVRLLSQAFPKLAKFALKPLMINGEDLKALNLAPGKDYRRILDAAAKAQWSGKISSRSQAMNWLRRHVVKG